MEIREAEIHDLPSILALQKLAYQSEAELVGDYSIPPLTQTIEGITDDFNNGTMQDMNCSQATKAKKTYLCTSKTAIKSLSASL